MTSITHFPISIPEYASRGKENYFPPIFGCPCAYAGKLHRHGFYERNVISFEGSYRICILRYKCPVCGKTCSQLPDFLIPYFQYSYDVIFTILLSIFLQKLSFLQTLERLRTRNSLSLSVQHLSFYLRRFIASRFHIHLFFASLLNPQFYQDMDPPNLTLSQFLHSLISKMNLFSNLHGTLNLTYFETMPSYFFSPRF